MAAIGWIVVLAVSALVTLHHNLEKKDVAASYANLTAGFNRPGQTPTERRQMAEGMISAKQNGIDLSLGGKFANAAERAAMWQAVREAADTGEPPSLSPPRGSWHIYFLNVGGGIFGCAVALSFITFLFYGSECIALEPREFIADFPWRKRWPYAFVLLTIIGAPFYAVSLVRIARYKRQLQREPLVQLTPHDVLDAVIVTELDFADSLTLDCAFDWTDDDTAAVERLAGNMLDEQQYFELRTTLIAHQADNARHKIEQEITRITEKIANFGRAIGNQRKLLAKFEQRALELKKAWATAQQLTRDDTDVEYQCLRQLSGVTDIEITEDGQYGPQIVLIVHARYTQESTTYDLGDWALITDASDRIAAYELRSGMLEGCVRRAPAYRIGLQFCFGKSQHHIEQLFKKGQLVEGFAVAVASLQHINEEDRALVPETFRVLTSG